jgi:3-oxoacyl-[acyl-carrier protein] reductase
VNLAFDFTERTALVTGAGQGIGHAITERFVSAGARVIAVDHDEDALSRAWGRRSAVLPCVADVSDEGSAADAIDFAMAETGRLDVVVNNAGITRDAVVWKLTTPAWDSVLAVHLGGTFNVTRCAVPPMRAAGYGRIINVTSYTGLHGNIGQANYAAAKAGIIGFSKTVAKETARFGITVNVVSPNARTAMVAVLSDEQIDALTALVPLQRFGEPSEMASAVAFLAAEESAYITGAVLPVDGGMSM